MDDESPVEERDPDLRALEDLERELAALEQELERLGTDDSTDRTAQTEERP